MKVALDVLAAAALAGSAAVLAVTPTDAARRLSRLLRTAHSPTLAVGRPDRRTFGRTARTASAGVGGQRVAAVLGGLGTAVVVGGTAGAIAGVAATVGLAITLGRLEPIAVRRARERISADLPVAADLLAAGVSAGAPIERVLKVVADAVGGPVGEALGGLGSMIRLGADPVAAWSSLAAASPGGSARSVPHQDGGLPTFARAVARALDSGAPLAPALLVLADEQRARRRAAAQLAARRVGVRAVGPLAVCFLPAFLLIGVVPVVVAIAAVVLDPLR